ncbi:hypothetical protein VTL71DRAFT_339 [Oculimacula yallundae]|uniref:Mid2 domain-containing protein n=1 Tax=Oculimacula yallundae TaxID=86028 RepID=A0ABR4D0U6_9HELO
MAPLPSVLVAQPRLNIRQNVLPLRPITLTVTRATTTFTTTMNLGEATNSPPSQDLTVNAAPTTSPDPIVKISSGDASNNTGVVIGALIGGLAAALLLIIFLWKCCHSFRYVGRRGDRDSHYDSDTSSSSSSSSISSPSEHRRRSGGAGFSRRNERGHQVEVPRRAYARRDKRSSHGSSSESRSDSTWMRSRRRSGWGDGLLNWVAGTHVRRARSRRGSVGSSGRRRRDPRFGVDD